MSTEDFFPFIPLIMVSYGLFIGTLSCWCRTRHHVQSLESRIAVLENHQISPTIVVPPPQQQVPYGYGYQVYPQQPRWYTPPAPSAPLAAQDNPTSLVV
jgi:hypothetical protein